MPAIDSLLSAVSPTETPAVLAVKESVGKPDEFEQAMSDALAPGEKNFTGKMAAKFGQALNSKLPTAATTSTAKLPQTISTAGEPAGETLANPLAKKASPALPTKKENADLPSPALLLSPVTAVVPPLILFAAPSPSGSLPEKSAAMVMAQNNFGSATIQTPTTAGKILMGDGVSAAPLNLLPSATDSVVLESAKNLAAQLPENAGQKLSAPPAADLPTSARLAEPLKADLAAMAPANPNAAATPSEKNPAGLLVPVAPDEAVLTEAILAQGLAGGSAPNLVATDLPTSPLVQSEPGMEAPVRVSALPANTGTGVASIPTMTKKGDKVEFFAGSEGQKLPVAGPTRSAGSASVPLLAELPPRPSEYFSSEFSSPLDAAGVGNNNFSATVSAASLASEARLQTVERAHDLVSAHALRLVESKADSMSVVLKPGGGTEISLELRQRDGVVEAQAFLSQGDHSFLNQHWSDLQARLELRGVKLGPLGGEESFTSGGNFSRQQSPSRDEEAERAAAFAEFAVVAGGATARSATNLRGWESWA